MQRAPQRAECLSELQQLLFLNFVGLSILLLSGEMPSDIVVLLYLFLLRI